MERNDEKRSNVGEVLSPLFLLDEQSDTLENGYVCDLATLRCQAIERVNILFYFLLQLIFIVWYELNLYDITIQNFSSSYLLLISFIITPFSLLLRFFEFRADFDRRVLAKIITERTSFWNKKLLFDMLIEVVLVMMVPNYFLVDLSFSIWIADINMHYVVQYNEILLAISLFRIFYYSPLQFFSFLFELQSPSSQRLIRIYSSYKNTGTFKFFLADSPITSMLIICIFSILLCTYLIRIFEHHNPYLDFENIYNSLWFTVVTMGTVGYGDYTPLSPHARLFSIATCMMGVILSNMITLLMMNEVQLSGSEKVMLMAFDDEVNRKKLEYHCINFIVHLRQVKYFIRQPKGALNYISSSYQMWNLYYHSRKISKYFPSLQSKVFNQELRTNSLMKNTVSNTKELNSSKESFLKILGDLEKLIILRSSS